jgi:ABC-type multidrug transport system fused ATPase/permease subunit
MAGKSFSILEKEERQIKGRTLLSSFQILGKKSLKKYAIYLSLQLLLSLLDILYLVLMTKFATTFLSGIRQEGGVFNFWIKNLSMGNILFFLFLTILGKNLFSFLLLNSYTKELAIRESEISTALIQRSLFQKLDQHKLSHSSELLMVSTTITQNLFANFFKPFIILIGECITFTSVAIGILLINPTIGVILFLYFLLFSFIFGAIYGTLNKRIGLLLLKQNSKWFKIYNEIKNSRTEIKLAKLEDTIISSLFDKKRKITKLQAEANLLQMVPRYLLEIATVFGLLILFLFYRSSHTHVEVEASLALMLGAGFRLLPSVNSILIATGNMRNALPSIERYMLFREKLLPNVGSDVPTFPYRQEGLSEFSGDLVFENVSFAYANSDVQLFENLNFTLKSKSTVLIRGENGSGKSTLLSLLTGLLSPTKGRVFNQREGEEIDMDTDRILGIRYLGQDFALLEESIAFNISLMKDQDSDQESLEVSAKRVGLFDFINSLESGFHTLIGENGDLLSGGQRQRVGLARCLYSNPNIIVFDEPTSSLDRESELLFWNIVKELQGTCTLVVISHGLIPEDVFDMEITIGKTIEILER